VNAKPLVWVLSRESVDRSWVVGVFHAPEIAMGFVRQFANVAGLIWMAPQPGHPYWMLDCGRVRYLVEPFPVRDSVPEVDYATTPIIDLPMVRANHDRLGARRAAVPHDDASVLRGHAAPSEARAHHSSLEPSP
jgi:hypothetical protein